MAPGHNSEMDDPDTQIPAFVLATALGASPFLSHVLPPSLYM